VAYTVTSNTKHRQLSQILEAEIRNGKFSVGSRFPTQRELMSRYSLSYATVSRALEELKRRGFISRRAGVGSFVIRASGLEEKARQTHHVGFLLCNRERRQVYYAQMLEGLEEEASRYERTVSYVSIFPEKGESAEAKVARLIKDVDGIFVTGFFRRAFLEKLSGAGVPIVAIGYPVDSDSPPARAGMVCLDARQGSHLLAQELLRQGRKRVALINGPSGHLYPRLIEQGFRDALAQTNSGSQGVQIISDADMPEDGWKCTEFLLQTASPPDALAVWSDRALVGVWHCLHDRRLQVPQDISLGYMGSHLSLPESIPHAVVRVGCAPGVLEKAAMQLLVEQIERPEKAAQRRVLPLSLLEE
jgi:DNA-binding LacI/PurR family transcriptional regulator